MLELQHQQAGQGSSCTLGTAGGTNGPIRGRHRRAGGNVGTQVQPASLQAPGASPISRYRKVMIGLLFIAFNSRFVLASFFSEEIFALNYHHSPFNEDFSHPFDS